MSEVKLPKDWKVKKLEDLLDYIQPTKYIVKSTDYDNSYKTPVLTAGKTFILGKTDETDGIFDSLPVIIFDDFTTANKLVNFKFKVKSSAMKILKPKDENVNLLFVYYYIQTIRISFDTHKRYWISVFSKLPIGIPTPETQQAIVSKIEELFSELEKGIEDLKTTQLQLKTYRQSVLKWAFEGKLTNENVKDGELPEGWRVVMISEIAKIETGTTPSKNNPDFYGNEFPFYKPTDLEAGNNVFKSKDGLTELGVKKARYVPEFSTLVTCIGATIGKTGFIKTGGGFNQQINAIVPNKGVNPLFVYYQAIGLNFNKQIIDNASATTLPIINKGKFQILKMVICDSSEQNFIVQEIESRLSVADKMEESIAQSLLQAEALRQSILKKAFSGELV
ncbi:restriction endonuclease subunit S [Flavobacterium sp. J49]|uniref:restriction endonuclease subunit S n=1 Tax=Flavobacterium sp. J49 TaxID=2718534 RepID=UPI001C3D76E4|nr:restriction endonuclease subunit S [Flavobacterium sp. J49]